MRIGTRNRWRTRHWALEIARAMPRHIPTDKQAGRVLAVPRRCKEVGFDYLATPG
jgi:hypothetical protein